MNAKNIDASLRERELFGRNAPTQALSYLLLNIPTIQIARYLTVPKCVMLAIPVTFGFLLSLSTSRRQFFKVLPKK